jgi:hypothetical protein
MTTATGSPRTHQAGHRRFCGSARQSALTFLDASAARSMKTMIPAQSKIDA